MITRVISGAQTGADRGALYGAMLAQGVEVGGWVPRGFRSEDGGVPQPLRQFLKETPSADYSERTDWNVRDSDATLILHLGKLGPGSQLTIQRAYVHKKPVTIMNLVSGNIFRAGDGNAMQAAIELDLSPGILNVAGPTETHAPGIQKYVEVFIYRLLTSSD